jgi:hypothetical protein
VGRWCRKRKRERTPHALAQGRDGGPGLGLWHSAKISPEWVNKNQPKLAVSNWKLWSIIAMMDPLASVSSVCMVSSVAECVVLKWTWLRISYSQDGRVETYVWNVGQGLSARILCFGLISCNGAIGGFGGATEGGGAVGGVTGLVYQNNCWSPRMPAGIS